MDPTPPPGPQQPPEQQPLDPAVVQSFLQHLTQQLQGVSGMLQAVQAEQATLRAQFAATASAAGTTGASDTVHAAGASSSSGSSVATVHRRVPQPAKSQGMQPPAQLWVEQLELWLQTQGVALQNEQQAVMLAASFLEGPAFAWFRQHRALAGGALPFADWEGFKAAFVRQFMPVVSEQTARQKISSLKQFTSVAKYTELFTNLLLQCGDRFLTTEADRIFEYRKGLKAYLIEELMRRNPQTLEDAQVIAAQMEAHLRSGGGGGARGISSGQRSGNGPVPMELGSREQQQQQQQQQQAGVECYRCGGRGHMSYDCTNPPRSSWRGRGRSRGRGRGRGGGSNQTN